jgi:hypothetical protein
MRESGERIPNIKKQIRLDFYHTFEGVALGQAYAARSPPLAAGLLLRCPHRGSADMLAVVGKQTAPPLSQPGLSCRGGPGTGGNDKRFSFNV